MALVNSSLDQVTTATTADLDTALMVLVQRDDPPSFGDIA